LLSKFNQNYGKESENNSVAHFQAFLKPNECMKLIKRIRNVEALAGSFQTYPKNRDSMKEKALSAQTRATGLLVGTLV